jgi:hypothetical protein
LVGALLILIAEVRTALPAAGSPAAGFTPPLGAQLPGLTGQGALGQIPSLAPQMLLHLFLQALPEELPVAETLPVDAALTSPAPDTTAWSAKAAQLESALSAALDTGVAAVTAWHDVPPPVVAAVDYARTVVLAVLGGESFNAEWLRPEWLGLAPRLERYWRRRRAGRRGLSNPDHGRETTHRDGRTDERDSS